MNTFWIGFMIGGGIFGALFGTLAYVRGHAEGWRDAIDNHLDIDRRYPGRGMIDP